MDDVNKKFLYWKMSFNDITENILEEAEINQDDYPYKVIEVCANDVNLGVITWDTMVDEYLFFPLSSDDTGHGICSSVMGEIWVYLQNMMSERRLN